jgi:glycosyltransferase involved in cell wall biosynthesis
VSGVKVSVVIPTHNRVVLLQRSVQSVLAQTFQDFEIIIVNDASTDSTSIYLQTLIQTYPHIQVITNQQSAGGSVSRNSGIAASRGEWIAFLDDDDVWLPEKLARQLTALSLAPQAVACSANFRVNYPLGLKKNITTPQSITLEQLLKANVMGGASVCICKAELLKSLGGFDAKLRSAQDWDLWVKLRDAGEIISAPQTLVDYFIHFEYRISNDMRGKYAGARRFYFKYRARMPVESRKHNIAFLCYIRSRQSSRLKVVRVKNLIIAMKYSNFKQSLAYLISSSVRILTYNQ